MSQSQQAAYSITSFCHAFSISRALLYRLLREGGGPQVFKVGRRTLISTEAADQWRRQLEGEKRN